MFLSFFCEWSILLTFPQNLSSYLLLNSYGRFCVVLVEQQLGGAMCSLLPYGTGINLTWKCASAYDSLVVLMSPRTVDRTLKIQLLTRSPFNRGHKPWRKIERNIRRVCCRGIFWNIVLKHCSPVICMSSVVCPRPNGTDSHSHLWDSQVMSE